MIAIIVETPYQLMNALNIVYSKYKDECMLFITKDMFMSNKKFIIETNNKYIKKVFYFRKEAKKINTIGRMFQKIVYKEKRILLRHIENFDKSCLNIKFDKIICVKYSNIALIIQKYMTNKAKIELIEEGIGEYLVDNSLDKNKELSNFIERKYLSAPSLYKFSTYTKIEKSPILNDSEEFKELLDDIFSYKKDLNKYKKIIYFQQSFSKDYGMEGFDFLEKKILDLIKKEIDLSNFTIKYHPRYDSEKNSEFNELETLSPWECSINDLKDINEMILISICSTALITPKLLCDKEPIVICTIKIYEKYMKEILKEYNYYENALVLFNEVKNKYRNKEKFMIPSTLNELKNCLKMYK